LDIHSSSVSSRWESAISSIHGNTKSLMVAFERCTKKLIYCYTNKKATKTRFFWICDGRRDTKKP